MKIIDKLPQDQFTCMATDEKNNEIWIGTKDDLRRHKLEINYWERFDSSTTNSILDDSINDIAMGKQYIYVLTKKGINIFHKDTKLWKLFKHTDSKLKGPIHSMVMNEDKIILCTLGNISVYSPKKDQWDHHSLPTEFERKNVKSLTPIKENQYAFVIEDTICLFDIEKSDIFFKDQIHGTSNCVVYDRVRNFLWVGLENGIRCLDLAKKEWQKNYDLIDNPNISHILMNDKFIFCIGDEKIFKLKYMESKDDLDPIEKLIYDIDDDKPVNWEILQLIDPGDDKSHDFEVIDAVLDDEWLWIATKNHGLIEHEFNFNEINIYLPQVDKEQNSKGGYDESFQINMFSGLMKSLILISDNDIWHFKKETTDWIQITPPDSIYPYPIKIGKAQNRLIKDKNSYSKHDLWFIVNEQVKKNKKKQKKDQPIINVQCLSSDENGLSIGTLAGLLRYSFDTYIWKKYSRTEGLIDDEVVKVISSPNLTLTITKKGLSILPHSTGSIVSWKNSDLGLDKAKDKTKDIEAYVFDEIVAICQKGSFQLYSKLSSEASGYDWKTYSLPKEFNKKLVSTFLRKNDVLWVGGDGFFGAFHMDDEEWITTYPISGKILSILLDTEKIWMLLEDNVYWAEYENSKINSSLNTVPISNGIDFRFIKDQLFILTRDSLYRLVSAEQSDHEVDVGEDDDDLINEQDRQTYNVEDFGHFPGKSKDIKPGAENIGFFSDINNIFVLTAGGTINRYNIYENEWSAYNRWDTHNCPIASGGRKIVRFDKDRLRWSPTALPFHVYPLETSQPGGGGNYIGSTIVVGDTLWYIERDNEDSSFGKLKKLNLKNGSSSEDQSLPSIGALNLEGKDILAMGNNHLFLFKNAKEQYTCYSLGYDYIINRDELRGLVDVSAVNKCPPLPEVPLPFGASIIDNENIWVASPMINKPLAMSGDFSLIGGGLFQCSRKNNSWTWMLKSGYDLSEEAIVYIGKNRNKLLFGTKNNLYFFSPTNGIMKTVTVDDGLPMKSRLVQNLGDDIWITSPFGYTIFNEKDSSMIRYDNPIEGQFVRQRFNKETKSWEVDKDEVGFEPPYSDILTIADFNTCMLFGTSLGVYEYAKEEEVCIICGISDGMSNQRIRSITRWIDHIILGTDNGLFIIPHGVI